MYISYSHIMAMVQKYYPSNFEELKWVISEVRELVLPETCHDLISSLPEQIKEIVNMKGSITKY